MDGRTRIVDAYCDNCADVQKHEIEDPGSCVCTVCGHVELLVVGSPAKGGESLDRYSPSLGTPKDQKRKELATDTSRRKVPTSAKAAKPAPTRRRKH